MPKLLLLALGFMFAAAVVAIKRAGPELVPELLVACGLVTALLHVVNEPDEKVL